jgi:fermentation-respiration switch protein FrsA (DUF1100 family)
MPGSPFPAEDPMRGLIVLTGLVLGLIAGAGCLQAAGESPVYTVGPTGDLHIVTSPPIIAGEVRSERGNITLSELVLNDLGTPVNAIFATPEDPVAAIVFAPGAGVPAEGHQARALDFAAHGIAFLVVDVRGNGGRTEGYPYSIQTDYNRFLAGAWPQTYAVALDMSEARRVIQDRYQIPVFASGESRGGMYAAVAAAADPEFSGYIGVSTAGFNLSGSQYTGNAGRFLNSIDPEYEISRVSPRPVWVLHAMADRIIPFSDGERLAGRAGEPKQFIVFNGTHGMNEDADRIIQETVLTFKDT